MPFCAVCETIDAKIENFTKNGAKIKKKSIVLGPKICIKSGFCNEPKIGNISHCAPIVF